jgi:hypothetical protein
MSAHADDLARLRAEAAQAKETMRELAGSTFAFYSGCLEAGFGEDHALAFTQTWLTTLIQTAPLSGMVGETGEMLRRMFEGGEE